MRPTDLRPRRLPVKHPFNNGASHFVFVAEWAEVLEQVGETDRALALYERAAEIVRTRLPSEHTGREMLLERYQTFLQRLGKDS